MTEFIIAFIISYIWHALGVTVGYHRLISHRAFKCPKPVEYFWVLAGYLAFEGSPIWWAAIHRAHHRYVDTPLDPHSPKDGWAHSYFGWMTHKGYAPHINPYDQCKDLVRDPVYRFLEQDGNWTKAHILTFATGALFRIILLVCFGWKIALANLVAAGLVLQVPLLLNLVCHIPQLGYKNYATGDDSVNVWWIGLLAMGEGWHNNHHAFPGSARSGLRPHEIDISWLTVRLMKAIGLVHWMNEASPSQLYLPPVQNRKIKIADLAKTA